MDDLEENSGFSLDSHEMSHQRVYDSNNSQKLPIRNAQNSRLSSDRYLENGNAGENMNGEDEILEDEEDHKDETMENEDYGKDGILGIDGDSKGKSDNNVAGQVDKYMDDEEEEDDYDDDFDDDEDDDDDDEQNVNGGNTADAERRTRKRKLKSLALSYEFAPRVPPPPTEVVPPPPITKLSSGGRNALADWTERESFVLLEAWGDRFVQRGKKSLRADEWQEVAEKVSDCEASRPNRTESQCRNRLDTLKKKYKKEKNRLAEMGVSSKWVYFRKMDMLMSSSTTEQTGLSCGLDSGEYVFSNPGVYLNRSNGEYIFSNPGAYLNRSNGMDEMRDSPGNSESSQKGEEEDSDGLPPKKRKLERETHANFRLLASSVKKFSKIYEKIENRRTQQMIVLEKMRIQCQRDLEAQRRQILESAQAEIARIRHGDGHDDLSNDNTNG